MSEPKQATDPRELGRRVLDSNVAKTESEWWAKARIEQLESENQRLLTVVKQARLVLKRGKGKADSLAIVPLYAVEETK